MARSWPLVGRAEEFAAISGALAGVGDYAGVLLTGDAGVGKTRLAREVLSTLSKHGEVRWVMATRSG